MTRRSPDFVSKMKAPVGRLSREEKLSHALAEVVTRVAGAVHFYPPSIHPSILIHSVTSCLIYKVLEDITEIRGAL